jgi:hypothetical protein
VPLLRFVTETLIVGEVQDIITKREGKERNTSKGPIHKVRSTIYYRHYSKKGYNSYTYKVEIEDTRDSNKFKE